MSNKWTKIVFKDNSPRGGLGRVGRELVSGLEGRYRRFHKNGSFCYLSNQCTPRPEVPNNIFPITLFYASAFMYLSLKGLCAKFRYFMGRCMRCMGPPRVRK